MRALWASGKWFWERVLMCSAEDSVTKWWKYLMEGWVCGCRVDWRLRAKLYFSRSPSRPKMLYLYFSYSSSGKYP